MSTKDCTGYYHFTSDERLVERNGCFLNFFLDNMFNDKKVIKKMKASGSPMRVMTRDKVIRMFQERENYLKGLLKELRKK